MLKFKTSVLYRMTIESVECERETEVSVYIKGRRNAKRGRYDNYFDSWDEAHAYLMKDAEEFVTAAKRALQNANDRLGNVKGMKKPVEAELP